MEIEGATHIHLPIIAQKTYTNNKSIKVHFMHLMGTWRVTIYRPESSILSFLECTLYSLRSHKQQLQNTYLGSG